DPTPWLRGGELLLTTGMQLGTPKTQRALIERLAGHEIAGLGFGTGFRHKRIPAALVAAARERSFPLFEVPYELPFIAITERAFAQLLNERYEMLQRNMAGDVLAEALTGHLYPEELQARLRPFGIGEQVAVLAFQLDDPSAAAALLERILERERVPSLVAIRAGLLCGVIDPGEADYGGELLRSLDVFIEHNGHWEKAAAALFCHRHTLRYRIRRIEQLTGRDLSSARNRIEFWLALRGRELAR